MPGRISLRYTHHSNPSTSSVDSGSTSSHSGHMSLKRRLTGAVSSSSEPHRPTFSSKSSSPRSSSSMVSNPASIRMTIESPPLVCYGSPKDSTGALLSGLIHLDVIPSNLTIESFKIVLMAEAFTRRPITASCPHCNMRSEEIHKWNIISEPVALTQGTSSYPFSYHIPGNLPASNSNPLGRIRYSLQALAISAEGDEIKFSQELTIARSILPGPERHSVRIFPPTNLSAHLDLPHVAHIGGDFPLKIRLDGVVCAEKETRWRLRKISWRIDELSQVISPSCPHHPSKLCGDGKGVLHEDVRVIGSGELKGGWKADYGRDGRIEMEMFPGIPAHSSAACDIDSPCGIKVSHNLVVEMIVAEEHCPTGTHRIVTATGAARVLRMQFHLIVTARGGLGISWDEEQPPIYSNIPPAPPTYAFPIGELPQQDIPAMANQIPLEDPPVYEGISA